MTMTRGQKQVGISILAGLAVSLAFLLANVSHAFPVREEIYTIIDGYGAEHSLIALLLAALTYYVFFYRKRKLTKGKKIFLLLVSLIFGLVNIAGLNLFHLDSLMIRHGFTWNVIFWFCSLGYALLFYEVGLLGISFFGKMAEGDPVKESSYQKLWLISFLLILAVWLIWIIVYYPASADYDAEWQIGSFLGLRPRSNHHPWFSSCVTGICYLIGKHICNDNLGMFLYILLRAGVMALIYSRCVVLLRKSGFIWGGYCALLFYAVTPVWGAYAKQPFKDTFCAALFCWYTIRLILLIKDLYQKRKPGLRGCLGYAISSLLVSLFRNNYIYVVIPVTLILLIVCLIRRYGWQRMVCIFFGVVLYFSFDFCITRFGGIESTEAREALSIPFQQTARTVRDHRAEISKEDREAIDRLLPFDELGENYDPVISDPVKNAARAEATKADYAGYFKVWLKEFFEHPLTYAEATLAGTYGYDTFSAELPAGGKGNVGMVILDQINKDPGAHFNEWFDFHYVDAFAAGRRKLESFYHYWNRIPLLNLTNTIPAYTWLIVLITVYLLMKRKGTLLLPCPAPCCFELYGIAGKWQFPLFCAHRGSDSGPFCLYQNKRRER